MAQTQSSESAAQVVRRRLSDIRMWQREGKSERMIAAELRLPKTSYRRALNQVEDEKLEAKESLYVDEGIPTNTHAIAQVYEGIHIPTSEANLALPEDISRLLPALWELQEILPVLKIMAKQWSEQLSLAQIPEQYQKYNAIYTVRLNEDLIKAMKAYTKQHRLTQSEFLTAAVLQLLRSQ